VTSTIQDVKARHEAELLAVPGVASVGIGLDDEGEPVIVVGLAGSARDAPRGLPPELEGYSVHIQNVGPIRTQ